MKDIWCNHEEFNTWKAIHLPNPKSTHIFFLVWINSLLLSKSKAKLFSINLCKTTKPLSEKGSGRKLWFVGVSIFSKLDWEEPTILRLMNRLGMEKSGKYLLLSNSCFCFEAVGTFQLEFQIKSNVHRNLSPATGKLFGFSSSIDQLWKFSWIP